MNVLAKICGMRSVETAKVAYEAGADFIGLILTSASKRCIDTEKAKAISREMKGKVYRVGVCSSQSIDEVNELISYVDLDFVQLHGDESPEFCKQVKAKVIKAFRLPVDFNIDETFKTMKQYSVTYYLIDRQAQGEGIMLSLEKASILAKQFPLIFAGGLTPENVEEVIKKVQPRVVDVAGGIETNGAEDMGKIKDFIKRVKKGGK